MLVDLTLEHFISMEDLLELIIYALRDGQPFSLTRWADSSNWIMSHGREPGGVLAYREGRLTQAHFDEYRTAFVRGVLESDVLGVFPNDVWTKDVMEREGLDITGKKLTHAWCNRHLQTRREWADEVLGRPWRTALVGNPMPLYEAWLAERFPLEVVYCSTAQDWPEVAVAMTRIWEMRPQLSLISAGWYTSCLVGITKRAGGVGLSYGHLPDSHMVGEFPPNTDFPRGIAGTDAHCDTYCKRKGGWIPQSREIQV